MYRVFYFILGVLTVVFGKDIARALIRGFRTVRQEFEGLATQIAEDIEDEAAEAEFNNAATPEAAKPKAVRSRAPKKRSVSSRK